MAADVGQLGAGGVGDLLLGEDGAGDLLLQEAVGGEATEERVDGGLFTAPGGVLDTAPGAAEHRRDAQQLPGVEGAPHIRPLEGGAHRLHPAEVGRPPEGDQVDGGGGLRQSPPNVAGIGEGTQGKAAIFALLGHRLRRQKLQDLGQLQGEHGFFKQFVFHRSYLKMGSYRRRVWEAAPYRRKLPI